MIAKTLIILSALFFSCGESRKQKVDSSPANNSNPNETVIPVKTETRQINAPFDTTSSDYLIYLLNNEKSLNDHWMQKLELLDEFVLPLDSMSHLYLIRDWIINDSTSVIILRHADRTGSDDYLLTVMNKRNLVGKVHIKDAGDSDLSLDNPYYYTEYKLINNRKVKLFNHKITGVEGGEEKDIILSIENWTIQDNGEVLKK